MLRAREQMVSTPRNMNKRNRGIQDGVRVSFSFQPSISFFVIMCRSCFLMYSLFPSFVFFSFLGAHAVVERRHMQRGPLHVKTGGA